MRSDASYLSAFWRAHTRARKRTHTHVKSQEGFKKRHVCRKECLMSLHNSTMRHYVTRKCETRNAWFVRYPTSASGRNGCHFKCHPKHKIAADSLRASEWGLGVTVIFSNYLLDNVKLTAEMPHVAVQAYNEKDKKCFFRYFHISFLRQSLFLSA